MKRITIVFILLVKISFSKNDSLNFRPIKDTLSESYKLNIEKIREHIYSKFASDIDKKREELYCYEYANYSANSIQNALESGDVYTNWDELEAYANKVLRMVMPENLRSEKFIHVYLYKDGDLNAFTNSAGSIFINIGMFPLINSEAELAGVLAHELGHYYFNHAVHNYMNIINGNSSLWFIRNSHRNSNYSIQSEMEADSIGLIWLNNACYSVAALEKTVRSNQRLTKHEIKKAKYIYRFNNTTHPTSNYRIERIKNFASNTNTLGKNFIVDENYFKLVKEESKKETLQYYLSTHDYIPCFENAFLYHIFEPDNKVYIYYILESIRRYCYLNDSTWHKNFITNNYFDSIEVNGVIKRMPVKTPLLEKFDLDILPIDPTQGKLVKTKEYWQEKNEFVTYEQAYSFFYQLSQNLNDPEAVLSNALTFTGNKAKRNEQLDIYLSFKNIKHREYAQALRHDSIYSSLRNKNLHVVVNFNCYALLKERWIYLGNVFNDKESILYKTVYSALANDTANEFLILNDLKDFNQNLYLLFDKLKNLSLKCNVINSPDMDLMYIDPVFWELFKMYNVNSISFDWVTYTTAIPGLKSVEAMKNILNYDHSTMWFESSNMKYTSLYYSSLKVKNNVLKCKVNWTKEQALKRMPAVAEQIKNIVTDKKRLGTN